MFCHIYFQIVVNLFITYQSLLLIENNHYWVNEMSDKDGMLMKILKDAISIEIYGREYDLIFSDIIEEENAKAIFRGLARDEGEHRELLEKEYKKVSGIPFDISSVDEGNRNKAREIFPEPLHSPSIEETKDIIKLGIRTEERSIELYSKSALQTTNESSKKLFKELTKFESEHKRILEDALYYFEQDGTWYGYSPPTIEG